MVNCSILGCKSRSGKKEDGISFHRFPSDTKKQNEWIKNINLSGWTPTTNDRICSRHFEEKFFRRSDYKVFLLHQAVPTIFPSYPLYLRPKQVHKRSYLVRSRSGSPHSNQSSASGIVQENAPDSPRKEKLKIKLNHIMENMDTKDLTVIKTEDESEDMSKVAVWTEIICKKEIEDSSIKEEFSYSEEPDTVYEIKTEDLMLKSESDIDDSEILDHWDVHKAETTNNYSCRQCDYKTNMKRNLTQHLYRHKTSEKYGCDHCEYKTYYAKRLKDHVLAKHNTNLTKNYNCDHCEYKTHFQRYLKKHVFFKHDDNAIKKHGCDHCDCKFYSKGALKNHVTIKHDGIKKHCCDHCEFKTYNSTTLKNHVQAKHVKNSLKKYNCNQCEYKSHFKNNLRNHVLGKHEKNVPKRHSCDHCEYTTNFKWLLKKHILAKHDKNAIKNFSCDQCEYKTHIGSYLKRHLLAKHKNLIKNEAVTHAGKAL